VEALTERGVQWSSSGLGLTEKEVQVLRAESGLTICGGRLNASTTTGYCQKHNYLTRTKPEAWIRCKEPGCRSRVRSTSTSGYCKAHRYRSNRLSTEPQFCRECEEPLPSDNVSGFCRRHLHLASRPRRPRRTCEYKYPDGGSCQARIRFGSKSGLCAIHFAVVYREPLREATAERTRVHRARIQATLAKVEQDVLDLREKLAKDEQDVLDLREKLSRAKAPEGTSSAKICRAIDAELPNFERLFAAPENVDALRKSARIGGLSKGQMAAVRQAIKSRDPKRWPVIAVRYYVAGTTGLSYEVVAKYDRPSNRLPPS
jgi:hypothetical protein